MSHDHYKKDVSHLKTIDVYRVCDLFGVTQPAIQHAVKKLLCSGKRGAKGYEQDLREAVDSINRALQMVAEDASNEGMDRLCAKLKACEPKSDQRGWPYLPEATDSLEAQAAVMRAQAEANEGWIEWVGGLCPASVGRNVDLKLRCGEEISFIPAELVSWYHYGNGADVIAYRVAPQC